VGSYAEGILFTNLTNPRGTTERKAWLAVLNRAPTLAAIDPLQIAEDSGVRTVNLAGISAGGSEVQHLMVTATSANPGVIANPISVNYVSPMSSGSLSLAPVTDAYGTSIVSVVVQDSGSITNGGTGAVTNSFRVTVQPVNDAPTMTPLADRVIAEGNLLTVSNLAQDVDLPDDQLTFSLLGGVAGSNIDPVTGILRWTPTEAQGPATNTMTVVVRDSGFPPLAATNRFTVRVLEVNSPPVLPLLGDRIVHEGASVNFTAVATDPDIPANRLTYSLGGGAPAGATMDPVNGVFHWIARATQVPATNQIMLIASDDGIPGIDAAEIFNIVVMARPRIESVSLSGTNLLISWTAIAGTRYAVEFNSTPDQGGWADLPGEVEATQPTAAKSAPVDGIGTRFYRVRVRE
jgi:hypothetical protein